MIRRHVWLSGRVQGVWFRDSMRRQATGLGLAGWVRNLPDGRVEAAFEGERDAVEKLTLWCHEGPPGARVTEVIVSDEPPERSPEFHIIH